MKNVCLIGHISNYEPKNDGQTVKTREICAELNHYSNIKLCTVDTQFYQKKLFSFLKKLFTNIRKNDYIILVVCNGGTKILVPLLTFLNIFYHKKICYCAIGSWLGYTLKDYPIVKRCLKKFNLILVETKHLKQSLNEMGYMNVEQMYNFKKLSLMDTDTKHEQGHFCTFSRVTKLKGMEDAIAAIDELNQEGYDLFLDIYGPVEKTYQEEFFSIMDHEDFHIRYLGNQDPSNSVQIICKYDLLLFPTRYRQKEGFPGTLIDAYSAGVPVVASNWISSSEFVPSDVGYVYNPDEENLADVMKKILKNRSEIEKKRDKCLQFVSQFEPSTAIKPLLNFLNSEKN